MVELIYTLGVPRQSPWHRRVLRAAGVARNTLACLAVFLLHAS